MAAQYSQAALASELSVHIEEYKALRAEVLTNMTASRSGTQLAITGLAALVALVGTIVAKAGATIALPLASLFFVGIVLTQIKYVYENLAVGAYLDGDLRLRILDVLRSMPDARALDPESVLTWEREDRRVPLLAGRSAFVVKSATVLVPALAALGSIGLYAGLVALEPSRRTFLVGGLLLSAGDVVLLAIALYWASRADRERHRSMSTSPADRV